MKDFQQTDDIHCLVAEGVVRENGSEPFELIEEKSVTVTVTVTDHMLSDQEGEAIDYGALAALWIAVAVFVFFLVRRYSRKGNHPLVFLFAWIGKINQSWISSDM